MNLARSFKAGNPSNKILLLVARATLNLLLDIFRALKYTAKFKLPLCGKRSDVSFSAGRTLIRASFDFYALPKGDVVFNLSGGFFRLRIVPRSILVCLIFDNHVVVTRLAFPRASRVRVACFEVVSIDRFGRKIMVPFYYNRVVAFEL